MAALLKPVSLLPLCRGMPAVTRCLSLSAGRLRLRRPCLDIPEPPKRPMGPFLLFMKDNMNKVDRLPDNNRPDMKRLGAMWKELDDSERQRYRQSYEVAKVEYQGVFNRFMEDIGGREKQEEYMKQLAKFRSDRRKYLENYRLKKLGLLKPNKISAMNYFMSTFLKGRKKEELPTGLVEAHAKWKALSEEEKKVYAKDADKAYKQRFKEYEKRLARFSK